MMRKLLAVGSFIASMGITALAFAAEGTTGGATEGAGLGLGVIGMGVASLGGALGQGKLAAAALEGIARNPGAATKVQTPMILALALIESLVLLSFLIAYMAQGKIH